MDKQLYLITFGAGHPCARFVQPIIAEAGKAPDFSKCPLKRQGACMEA